MPTKTTARVLAVPILLACLLTWPGAANAHGCDRSNIDSDHITPANDFQVHGRITCENAFRSATGYTDSAAAADTTTPGTETFTAEFYEWRYRWTCRTTALPVTHGGLGAYFRCRATEELGGRRRSGVSMSFKWWLSNERSCPDFALNDEVNEDAMATEVHTTRNASCAETRRWLKEAAEAIQYHLAPYKTEPLKRTYENEDGTTGTEEVPRYFYRYINDGQYQCIVSPTELSDGGTKGLQCEPMTRSWQSREYGFTEK
jgi:hypothetical protein